MNRVKLEFRNKPSTSVMSSTCSLAVHFVAIYLVCFCYLTWRHFIFCSCVNLFQFCKCCVVCYGQNLHLQGATLWDSKSLVLEVPNQVKERGNTKFSAGFWTSHNDSSNWTGLKICSSNSRISLLIFYTFLLCRTYYKIESVFVLIFCEVKIKKIDLCCGAV